MPVGKDRVRVRADTVQMDPAGLLPVEEIFQRQIDQGLHPGAALAVYRHGRLVLDLHGGVADCELGTLVNADTMFVLYPSTKPLAAHSVGVGQVRVGRSSGRLLASVCPEW